MVVVVVVVVVADCQQTHMSLGALVWWGWGGVVGMGGGLLHCRTRRRGCGGTGACASVVPQARYEMSLPHNKYPQPGPGEYTPSPFSDSLFPKARDRAAMDTQSKQTTAGAKKRPYGMGNAARFPKSEQTPGPGSYEKPQDGPTSHLKVRGFGGGGGRSPSLRSAVVTSWHTRAVHCLPADACICSELWDLLPHARARACVSAAPEEFAPTVFLVLLLCICGSQRACVCVDSLLDA